MVHIRILQPDQSLPHDSAVIGDKYIGSLNGLDEYGIFEKSIAAHSSGDDNCKENARRPNSNTKIQGKAIRMS